MNQRHAELSAHAADLRETEISVNQAILSHVLCGAAQPSGFTAEWTTLFRTVLWGFKPRADCSADSPTRIEVCLKNLWRLKKEKWG